MATIKDYFKPIAINRCDHQEVLNQLGYAKSSKVSSGQIQINSNYRYTHLNTEQLAALYKACFELHKQSKYEEVMNYHLFDLEDHILRLVSQDIGLSRSYQDLLQDLPLAKKIDKVIAEPSRFFDLEPIQGGKIQTIADYQIKQNQVIKPNTERPTRVLKLSGE